MAELTQGTTTLKRSLGAPLLTLYGLGTILGAGIYVLIGEVAVHAGSLAPVSFLVAALLASFSAFSFAELSARIPKSAGEAAYAEAAFGARTGTIVGLSVVLVGSVSAATISVGFHGYLETLVAAPKFVTIPLLVLGLGTIAAIGVNQSVGFAAVLTVIEVLGLLIVFVVAAPSLADVPSRWQELTPSLGQGHGVAILLGSFVAFYAFIGFEDIANMAEEVKNPKRSLPIAIFAALAVSGVLYVGLALVSVLAVPADELALSSAPLAQVFETSTGRSPTLITLISLFAVSNGALIQIIMGARILYGLSSRGAIPKGIGAVNRRTRTPVAATILISTVILVLALAFPLGSLAQATTFITLSVFAVVNASLWILKGRSAAPPGVLQVPRWIPATGFLVSVGFVGFRVIEWAL